jgi:hypothetical protein
VKCPHCGEELKIAPRVVYNVDCYNKSVVGATECCSKLVNVRPVRSVVVTKYTGEKTEDDWGVSVK